MKICFVFISSYTSIFANNTQSISLEELRELKISTADKTPVAVKDIPASVTIITREEIERYGYITLSDIIRNIPGMYILDNTESLFIGTRGIEGGGIEFLVNGIPQHPSLQKTITATDINKFNVPVESIDRIEVIRGPMSVLYGNNAFQGVINIITNNAASQGSMASASIGTKGVSRQFARYAIEKKEYRIVVNVGRYTTDGLSGDYTDMLSSEQLSKWGGPAYDTKIDDRVPKEEKSFDLSAAYGDFELNIRHNIMHYGLYIEEPNKVQYGISYLDLETTHASISYATYLNPYWKWKLLGVYSQEEFDLPNFYLGVLDAIGYQNQTSRRQDFESTLVYSNDALKSIFGYRYCYIDDVKNDFSFYDSNLSMLINLKPYSTHELYSQVSYDITSKLSVTGGLRYSHIPEQFEQTLYDRNTSTINLLLVDTGSNDKVSGRLAVMYQANNHHSIRAIVGNAVQYRDKMQISDSEKINSYELQHIFSYPDVQLQSSLFYNTISNIVQRELVSGGSDIINYGDWKTVGVEFVGSMQFAYNWRGSGSLVYQKSKEKEYDMPIVYSPKVTAKIKTDYVEGSFIYGLNVVYVGDMEAGYETGSSTIGSLGEKVDDYFLVGANIRYAPNPNYFINLKADNLLDETYHYPANEIASMEKGLIGMGRVVMLSAGYKF